MAYEIAVIIAFIGISALMLLIGYLLKSLHPIIMGAFIAFALMFMIPVLAISLKITDAVMYEANTSAGTNASLQITSGLIEGSYNLLMTIFRVFLYGLAVFLIIIGVNYFIGVSKRKKMMVEKASHEEE